MRKNNELEIFISNIDNLDRYEEQVEKKLDLFVRKDFRQRNLA
jgi:hypothetical protein